MPRKKFKTVLVIVPTGDYTERLKLEGIVNYSKEKKGARWALKFDIGGTVGVSLRRRRLAVDGVIAYIQSESERKHLLQTNIPTVFIEDLSVPKRFPRRRNVTSIVCDHISEGRTAARYFIARNYENFAFVGADEPTAWGELRKRGFADELTKEGHACQVFPAGRDLPTWLRTLPKPCAVLAVRDIRARQVLDAADEAGVAVPQELAVLGVDDDKIMCDTSFPTLSSIPTFDHSLGYAAGRALNLIMTGKSNGGIIYTRHSRVVTRGSTDADAVADTFVARALSWARRHLSERLDAESLANAIGYSRRALSYRTEKALGITISEAVKRIRLSAAKELLSNTQLPIAEIAEKCGFASTSHLSLRLRESTGLTPRGFRRNEPLRTGCQALTLRISGRVPPGRRRRRRGS